MIMSHRPPSYDDLMRASRRHFLGASALGLGALAMGDVLATAPAPQGPSFAPRAKRVIYLFQSGGPSQFETLDPKPGLRALHGQPLPASVLGSQRLTGMSGYQASLPIASSFVGASKHGASGIELSDLLPHTAKVVDDLCVIRSMHTEAINHDPAITFFASGHQIAGRPSMGAWLSYGLGSMNRDLPSFIVLVSKDANRDQPLYARLWGSGFLPSEHQGCRIRAGRDAVLHLRDPEGVTRQDRRRMLDLLVRLNEEEFERSLDQETRTRIAQHEMAYRMQMSVPELTDFSTESKATLEMYGPDVHVPGSFAANCLLARRLVERDVRFVQLYMRGWDQHNNLPGEIRAQCRAVDQPQAALIKDLKQRGLLDDTIVLWSGEFGRTVYSQGQLTKDNYGRDHHPRCFTAWMAGGGVNAGTCYGKTDDYSYNVAEDPVEVHDLHATLLHLLGFDHTQLTYRFQGRDYRLTDVKGSVVKGLIA